ncbi:MAG: hypothetical protein IJV31_12735 [Clostridia bacterium]|nr:hypothetical protein [Clostridia bacterium]
MLIISQYLVSELSAGPKAKKDIEKILKEEYNSKIYTLKLNGKEDKNFANKLMYKIRKAIFSLVHFKGKELIIVQFPFNNKKIFTNRAKNKIAFIHDLDGIRKKDINIEKSEIESLNSYKYIIAHNNKMKQYLIEKGIDENKIYVLELFDYICKGEKVNTTPNINDINIVYTGNFEKSPFIKQLEDSKMKFNLFLYGNGNVKSSERIFYKGKFLPDELPNKIEGDLGLVWDGNFDESDENQGFKNYTKYNNPHKLSCYIAAGIPVIVWEKSAVAEFVKNNDIGYLINNIYDINELDFSKYEQKKKNIKEIKEKVRKGYYTKKIIKEIF